MGYIPERFIDVPVVALFDTPPAREKVPGCPNTIIWDGETYRITELISEWHDYSRKGRMGHNMRPGHADLAARRGSWGVGRDYFRIRTDMDRIFEIYYDRSPSLSKSRKGGWFLFQEMEELPEEF